MTDSAPARATSEIESPTLRVATPGLSLSQASALMMSGNGGGGGGGGGGGAGGTSRLVPPSNTPALSASMRMSASSTSSSALFEADDNESAESALPSASVLRSTAQRATTHAPTAADLEHVAATLEHHSADMATLTTGVKDRLRHLLHDVRRTKGTSLAPADVDAVADAAERERLRQHRRTALAELSRVPPFSYLPADARRALVDALHVVQFVDGEVVVQQGSAHRDVYVTTRGRVMLVELKTHAALGASPLSFLGYLDAPAYFGEWETLFEAPRKAQVIAGGDVAAYRMSGEQFERLLAHASFRYKLALGMRVKGLFGDIESFVALVRRAVAHEKSMNFVAILEAYRRMVPAIHARLHAPTLDIDGWTYAVRRLPDTITSTYVYLLSNSVPMPFMHEHFSLREIAVPTAARRRRAFAVDHGKLLVLMRERFSDVLDFMTLLCAHVHESAKLRTKLNVPAAFEAVHRCLWANERRRDATDEVASATINAGSAYAGFAVDSHSRRYRGVLYERVSVEAQAVALARLPLNDDEVRGLQSLWPDDFLYRVWDMIVLHEDIQVLGDFSASYVEASDRWAEGIRRAVVELIGTTPPPGTSTSDDDASADEELCVSTDLETHIISSNTTSVRNLLSPYVQKNKEKIRAWGVEQHPEIEAQSDLSDSDKLYALTTAYLRAHASASAEQDEFDAPSIKTLRHTELTGIQVELIDLDALERQYAEHNIDGDSLLAPHFRSRNATATTATIATTDTTDTANNNEQQRSSSQANDADGDVVGAACACPQSTRRRLLVNIDYAFGKQAEQLISALSLLFGQSLKSVGVMGKAGGLQGKRGDVIVADYLMHQEGDEMTPIDNHGVDRDALHRMSKRSVWSGGVLTVLGTLLQDTKLLHYYKKLHGCVSLEMEGSFYARELVRFKRARLLRDDVRFRFLYYVSDTPLSNDQTATLSKDLDLSEVIPPLYAVTRELLRLVLIGD